MLRRGDQPWLLLPSAAAPARLALDLFQAQTLKARSAKHLMKLALRCGWFPCAESVTVARTGTQPWETFLHQLAGGIDFPMLASLAGNPAVDGRRLVFLVFDSQNQPRWVVKVGSGERSVRLIDKEISILKSLPPGTPSVPIVRGELSQIGCRAFAMDFFPGTAPRVQSNATPGSVLNQWIERHRETPLESLPALQQLAVLSRQEAWFDSWWRRIAPVNVHPVIMHGDFAPWNIRVKPSSVDWTVVDWERGDLTGVPTWDWFHFVIQPEILVRRRSTAAVVERVDRLLNSDEFIKYAQATKSRGYERDLLLAYLAHAVHVIRPAEGLAATQQLLEYFRA